MPLEVLQLVLCHLNVSGAKHFSRCSKNCRSSLYMALQADHKTAQRLLVEAMEEGKRWGAFVVENRFVHMQWLLEVAALIWGDQSPQRMDLQVCSCRSFLM